MQYRSARAFAYEAIERLWDDVCSRGEASADSRRAMMLSLSLAFRTGRCVAQSMYDLVGTTAVFATKSPLDRLLRDAITMSQHVLLGDGFLEMVGATMLGEVPAPMGIL
jgi:hypothetical protein